MTEFLKNFNIDRWFKVLIYLGATLFLLSLFLTEGWLMGRGLGLPGLGLFFIGLGGWKREKMLLNLNHPTHILGPAGLIQYPIQRLDFIGASFFILGFVFLALFFKEIL